MTRRLCWLIIAAVAMLGGYGAILAVYPEARPWPTSAARDETGAEDRAAERRPPPIEPQETPAAASESPTAETPAATDESPTAERPAAADESPTAERPAAADESPTAERPAATDRSASVRRRATRYRPATRQRPGTMDKSATLEISATIVIPPADEVGPLKGCPKKQIEAILGVTIAQPHGLGIGTVVPDGPAAKAGIRPGDQLAQPSECPSGTIGRFLPRDDSRTVSVTIRRPKSDQAEGQADGEPASDAEDQAAEAPPDEKPSP